MVVAFILQCTDNHGQHLPHAGTQILDIGKKYARIPQKLAAFHKHLSKFAVGLFRKGLHTPYIILICLVAQLHVSIARLGTRRFHTHRKEMVKFLNKFQSFQHVLLKNLFFKNSLIAGYNKQICFRIPRINPMACPCHTRSRVAINRFSEDIKIGKFRQLFFYKVLVLLVRADKHTLRRNDLGDAVKSGLQQRAPR